MALWVYILAGGRNGTLYTGMTDNLGHRMWEHGGEVRREFTARCGVKLLVYYEQFLTREGAFRRERAFKKWNRLWELELIERFNPGWRDLYDDLAG